MVYIVFNKIPLFIKALSTVAVGKDSWTTVICTPSAVILHTAADDQCCTAAGSMPKELFIDYRLGTTMTAIHKQQRGAASNEVIALDNDSDSANVQSSSDPNAIGADAQFMVHVQSLIDALTIAGPSAFLSPYLTVTISFPERDGRLLVELSEPANTTANGHAKLLQCHLITRPLRERMLDLRFQDSLVANRLCLHGDVGKVLLGDLAAFQCEHVRVSFTSSGQAIIEGLKGPFGDMSFVVDRTTDGVLALEVVDTAVVGTYPLTHFAAALSSGGRSALPNPAGNANFGGGRAAGGPADAVPDIATFSRLTLNFNRERQLCVMHRAREHDVQVRVDVVITPLSTLMDDD